MKVELRIEDRWIGIWRNGQNLYHSSRNPYGVFKQEVEQAIDHVCYYCGVVREEIETSPAYRWVLEK